MTLKGLGYGVVVMQVGVRCWVYIDYSNEDFPVELVKTFPEGTHGHSLICCTTCGVVYGVTLAKEIYVGPPLQEKLDTLDCATCGENLGKNWAYYPETYVVDGKLVEFEVSADIPDDSLSVVRGFPGIYE